MKVRFSLITTLVALAGCAHAPAIVGLSPLIEPGRTLVLGEVHGTREVADFTAAAVEQAAQRGPVVLGLEVPNEPQFEAYLSGDGSSAAQAALLSTPFWTAAYQDGRQSVALLGLLERVRVMRQRGLSIDLLLFDAQPQDTSQRDREMAEKVMERHAQRPQAAFILVMGNLHARKLPGSPWKPDDGYQWLTSRLTWPLVSLNAAHGDGTAWICGSAKAEECGPRVVAARESNGKRSVTLAPSKEGYDGVFDVVTFTASPPAAFPEKARGFDEKLTALLNGPELKIGRARKAAMTGDYGTCASTLSALPDLGAGELYDLACCQSQLKQLDAAFDALTRSLAAGFDDFTTLDADTDLANLRADPRWRGLPRR